MESKDIFYKINFWQNKGIKSILQFSSFLLFRCVQPNLCNDEREKANINPFGSISHSSFGKEDVLNFLIESAQNAECPEKGARCCSTKFISTKGKFYGSLSIRNALIRNDPSNSSIIRNHDPLNFQS